MRDSAAALILVCAGVLLVGALGNGDSQDISAAQPAMVPLARATPQQADNVACCTANGCKQLTFAECFADNATNGYAPGEQCSEEICNNLQGACCFPDGRIFFGPEGDCQDGKTRNDCVYAGGLFFFRGESCNQTCAQIRRGACCTAPTKNGAGATCEENVDEVECRAKNTFVSYSYNKTCSEADCNGKGACCKPPDAFRGETSWKCEAGSNNDTCYWPVAIGFGLSGTYLPGQNCGTPCEKQLGACCTLEAGKAVCKELEQQACQNNANYVAFAFGKKCTDKTCGRYGACCATNGLFTRGECLAGLTRTECRLTSSAMFVWLPSKKCQACDELKGCCCLRSSNGTIYQNANQLTKQECEAKSGFVAFSGKACKDTKCNQYGACCIEQDIGTKIDIRCDAGSRRKECAFNQDSGFVPGASCAPKCEKKQGACCLGGPNGATCRQLTRDACHADKSYIGFKYATSCQQANCNEFGACCGIKSTCRITKDGSCYGLPFFPGQLCAACNTTKLVGACCDNIFDSPTCEDNVEISTCLTSFVKSFKFNKTCTPDLCKLS